MGIPPSDRAGAPDESSKATLLKPTGPTTVDRKKLAADAIPASVTRSPIAATPVAGARLPSSAVAAPTTTTYEAESFVKRGGAHETVQSSGWDERRGRNEPDP